MSLVAKLHHLRCLVPLSQLVPNLTQEKCLISNSEANVLRIVERISTWAHELTWNQGYLEEYGGAIPLQH